MTTLLLRVRDQPKRESQPGGRLGDEPGVLSIRLSAVGSVAQEQGDLAWAADPGTYDPYVTQPFVGEDFVVPRGLAGPGFRLEPLGPQHNEADHRAWTSSIDHIHSTPGFANWKWPPADGLTLAENLRDLRGHANDFEQRKGFTYTVLDQEGLVVGCVYIYPSKSDPQVPRVNSWVSADFAELDVPLYEAVSRWLEADWPFEQVQYR